MIQSPSETVPVIPLPAKLRNRVGVHLEGDGLDIVVVAPNADAVHLCIFDSTAPDAIETQYKLQRHCTGVWHGHLQHAGTGTVYGFRAYGDWDPDKGHVYNPQKLLLDPYARGIVGEITDEAVTYAHVVDDSCYPIQPMQRDDQDSAPFVPRSVVVSPSFEVAPHPRTPWNKTVIYEAHIKGLTLDMPGVPEELRGTYAGLAHPTTVDYLKHLGITAIELLPIHAKHDELFLAERGLTNYWGYSTLNYFSPEPSYATAKARASGPQAVLDEVCGMVSILHEAGIEVILDVVYNHTCEGSITGRSLSWRGLDNHMYYMSDPTNPGINWDVTGCGNSMDFAQQRVVQMTLDSLRYWAEKVGIDGFRFDLGVTLGRFGMEYTRNHPFLIAAATDPVISASKLIAEPWDIGPSGWQTGNFPIPFSDWNDRFRDCVRNFWLVDAAAQSRGRRQVGALSDLATRLAGSADLFWPSDIPHGRGTRASINFVTAHDGFTMADLVCYNHKHNEANLESNRDGSNDNKSWNHGVEGRPRSYSCANTRETISVSDLQPMRLRSIRNMMGTLLVSAGTPMILAGDESGRSQKGNNNAYCQDSEISWMNWHWEGWQKSLFDTVRHLIELRHRHPVMRPTEFATGTIANGDTLADLSWFGRDGKTITPNQWSSFETRVLQMLRSGLPYEDNDMLVIFNGTLESSTAVLAEGRCGSWHLVWDSTWEDPADADTNQADDNYDTESKSARCRVCIEPLSMQIYLSEELASRTI